jgi:peptidoglycan/LPS O-acetylase OafA/YrhL
VSTDSLWSSIWGRIKQEAKRVDKARPIPTLDGWRAIAILMVVAHHFGTAFYAEKDYYNVAPTRYGTWGVPVFFALSGILITKLLLQEFDRTGAISLKSFYIRRSFRILPPASMYVICIAALGLVATRIEFFGSIFFLRNWIPDSIAGIFTAHFWSLGVEEHFYLLWPSLLVLLGVGKRGFAAAATISIGLALWMSADFHYHLSARILPHSIPDTRTDLRLLGLFCGCSMAFVMHWPNTRAWLQRRYTFLVWLLMAAALAGCLRYQPYLTILWISILIPVLMAGTTLHPRWWISRFLDLALMKWIGRISYSLYIWQQLFLLPFWERKPLGRLQEAPFNLVLAFLVAAGSYYFVEKPLIRIGHKLAGRAKSATAEPKAHWHDVTNPPRTIEMTAES